MLKTINKNKVRDRVRCEYTKDVLRSSVACVLQYRFRVCARQHDQIVKMNEKCFVSRTLFVSLCGKFDFGSGKSHFLSECYLSFIQFFSDL